MPYLHESAITTGYMHTFHTFISISIISISHSDVDEAGAIIHVS